MGSESDRPGGYRQARFQVPPGACEILLIRHGESEPAVPGVPFPLVDGQGDPGLAPDGRVQAERVAERLAVERIDAIYVSTLRRTGQTAEPLAGRLGLTPNVEPDLREVHLGEWEGGLFRRMVAENHPIAQRMSAEERWDVIPGAEPAQGFSERVRKVLAKLAAAHRDQRLAVFTHGGFIAEALAAATGSRPFAFLGADNGSVSHLVVTDQRWILRRYNDTAHMDAAFSTTSAPLT
ncbi:putative phosphoglycerate mutase [Thermocatellispora tengchongensis]|uniref:Putative phosphoglycerate mutase n=1 Tax=Thermocatellispora tengchongensis TaxID=1073253 RepID=A0A840NZQ5_9ACTN|nr:histidine phosphatase family protein [Thermocatellispora tengchongensis]MBB5130650.1 putative phosphoglycerate mutase [Thermocatellispora tengchongensis]